MAATGYTPIQLYYSTTASAVPIAGNLANGELAINITDGKLYYKNNSGTVTLLAGATGAIAPITANGVVYVNSSGQATSGSALTFDGTALTSLNNSSSQSIVLSRTSATARNWALGVDGDGGFRLTDATGSAVMLSIIPSGVAYLASASELIFKYNTSVEGMRLTSNGLGIGTSSPTAKLQINGTTDASQRIIVGGTGNTSSYKLNYNGSEVGFIQNYQNTEMSIGTTVAASLGFNTNNTQRFVITSAGALGIGASPSYGSSGQVLTSQGSGSPPIWAAAGGGGSAATPTTLGTVYGLTNSGGNFSISLGYQAGNTSTGTNNTSIGYQAGYTNNDNRCTFLGYRAGYLSNALENTFLGYQAGVAITSGDYNTFVGTGAGSATTTGARNTFVGRYCGTDVTTGTRNTVIGWYSGNQDGLDIRTASNYAVISDGDGNRLLSTANGQTLALDGGAVPNSGTGITFPATQSASSNANTLDDYEEGTVTPSVRDYIYDVNCSYTLSSSTGQYTKIGRQVTYSFTMTFATFTAGNGQYFGADLPFPASASTCFTGTLDTSSVVYQGSRTAACVRSVLYSGQVLSTFGAMADSSGATKILSSGVSAGDIISGTIVYFTD